MARASMADLIDRLRAMVGDPAGDNATWTDDELQAWLDARRRDLRDLELIPEETVSQGGVVSVLDYRAPGGLTDWEADGTFADGAWTALTPASSDWLTGHWTFEEHTPPPVRLTGKTYDLCGSAADTLEAWAARTKQEYDFATGDQTFRRGQQTEAMLGLAERYRARQRAVVGRLTRCF